MLTYTLDNCLSLQFAYSVLVQSSSDPTVAVDIAAATANTAIASKPRAVDVDDDPELNTFLDKDFDVSDLRQLRPDEGKFAADLKQIIRRESPAVNVDQSSSPAFLSLDADPSVNTNVALNGNANGEVTPTLTARLQPKLRLHIPIQSTVSASSTLGGLNIQQLTPTLLDVGSTVGLNTANTLHLNPSVGLSIPVGTRISANTGTNVNLDQSSPTLLDVGSNSVVSLAPSVSATIHPTVRLHVPLQTHITANADVSPLASATNINADLLSPTFLDVGSDTSGALTSQTTSVELNPTVSATLHPRIRLHLPIQSHITANADVSPLSVTSGANINVDQSSPTFLNVGSDASVGVQPTIRLHVPIQSHIDANANVSPVSLTSAANLNVDQTTPSFLVVGSNAAVNADLNGPSGTNVRLQPTVRLNVPIQTHLSSTTSISNSENIHIDSARTTHTESDAIITPNVGPEANVVLASNSTVPVPVK